eukprot:2149996-Prymnesium_polylepis.1
MARRTGRAGGGRHPGSRSISNRSGSARRLALATGVWSTAASAQIFFFFYPHEGQQTSTRLITPG